MLTLSTTILTLYPSATHYVLCRVLSLRSPSLSSPARAYIFVFSDVLWASISLSLDIIKHSAVCFSRVIIKRSHFTPPPPRFEHGSPHYSDVPITDNKQTLHLLVTKAINTFLLGSIWHFQYTDDAWSLSSILLGWKKKGFITFHISSYSPYNNQYGYPKDLWGWVWVYVCVTCPNLDRDWGNPAHSDLTP